MIIKDSHIPIYFQLEMEIKEIVKGLNPGDPISSEREFSEKYDISRMTVRQAINNLVNEGILVRKRGKGTFVAEQKVEQPLSGLTSFSEDMRSRGLKPLTKILSFQQISSDKNIAAKLKIAEGVPVYEVSRLRLADESPMALEISYLPANIITDLTEDTVYASLYEYIENELNLQISHATQTLESSLAQKSECSILQIEEGDPVLLIERFSYLQNGEAFEYVKSIYRGDRYKFVIDMKR
ncbi:GntR family transcriptional regulator [Niallia taxi]|uniref:GntR family transcriptional regulator n=1 Tax=Niallia taxi TaxID=2499688 RepID=UPI0011A1982F|nr:GntR family transcriptional regulator [Niallia taxi]MCT2342811.1 GntR family transcriptional regulator [Niallia taxi]MDE5051064.1 GntR family transcriptional regulator [Niallia taxi]MED3962492.1 GntR family transcriptional regulator [Niallia taxi]WOD62479.1 GntR family transcriptional regulator [Niallia taxi]